MRKHIVFKARRVPEFLLFFISIAYLLFLKIVLYFLSGQREKLSASGYTCQTLFTKLLKVLRYLRRYLLTSRAVTGVR
jgi:hypothetical protein